MVFPASSMLGVPSAKMRFAAFLPGAMVLLPVAFGFALPGTADASIGPQLSAPRAALVAGLTCSPDFAGSKKAPVLLTPAFSDANGSYSWNYMPQLAADGIPFCSISTPDGGYGDLQRTAEYVVYAVRRMSTETGRKVTLVGHQHGGLDELWALKFWPGMARSVSDLITLETPHAGTTSSSGLCAGGGHCTAALRQITKGSNFLKALRPAPRPKGVAITSITSLDDALITPQPAASTLRGGTNIVLQDVCPGRKVDHFAALADAVAYRLFRDARSHPGGGSAERLPETACDEQYMPSANPAFLSLTYLFLASFYQRNLTSNDTEPQVAGYAVRGNSESGK